MLFIKSTIGNLQYFIRQKEVCDCSNVLGLKKKAELCPICQYHRRLWGEIDRFTQVL